jgi:hypothetical protein
VNSIDMRPQIFFFFFGMEEERAEEELTQLWQ